MADKCKRIIGHGINCFVNRQLIYNFPEQIFADAGVMAIEHADFDGIERLALVTGRLSTLSRPRDGLPALGNEGIGGCHRWHCVCTAGHICWHRVMCSAVPTKDCSGRCSNVHQLRLLLPCIKPTAGPRARTLQAVMLFMHGLAEGLHAQCCQAP